MNKKRIHLLLPKLRVLGILIIVISLFAAGLAAAADPTQIETSSIRLTLTAGDYDIIKDQNGRDVITMKGFGQYISPGNPILPRNVYNIAVPPDIIWASLEMKVISSTTYATGGIYDLKPAGPLMAAVARGKKKISWGGNKNIVKGKNVLVYETRALFPANPVRLLPYSQMRKWKFTKVEFFPVQYDPVSQKLHVTDTIEIEISYQQSTKMISQNLMADTMMDDIAAGLFLNYDQAANWYTSYVPIDDLKTELKANSIVYPYVIITTNYIETYSTRLADFIAHKNRSQRVLVVTEDDYDGLTGQPPNNRAEKIRQWLINNYEDMRIMYVLLIGDPTPFENGGNEIPMKMCWPRYGAKEYQEAPTDAFYADLTGNWDKDGDEIYGEFDGDYDVSGGVDFAPEVYVGRIPMYEGNFAPLNNILQKIIDYETEPIEEQNWRQSVLLPMSFSKEGYDGAPLAEQMIDDYLNSANYAFWRMYQQGNGACEVDSDYPSEEELRGGTVVQNRWANTDFGIVCWWGHGSSTGVSVGYEECWDGDLMTQADTLSLDDDHPAFTYQCSCNNGWPETSLNLQFAILQRGGIATVSSTRVSWFYIGQGYGEFDDKICTNAGLGYEYVENLVANAWFSAAGPALCHATMIFADDCRDYLMNRYDFNLYGDPSTSLYSHARLEVFTTPASDIGSTSVTLNGQLFDMGSTPTVDVSFLWGQTFPLTNETPPQTMNAAGNFSAQLTNLNPETTYHFCAKAVGNKVVEGVVMDFTTSTIPPRVTTNWVTDITPISVILHGDLTSLGSASSVQVSFEWGTSTSYGNETIPQVMNTTGPFSTPISGLIEGITYYFRAKAVGHGTRYGDDKIFTPGSMLRVPGDYSTIQSALDIANPGQIVTVADGIYTGTGNKNLDFDGKEVTLQSENGPENCIIDCQYDGRGFDFDNGESQEAIVSGFTIRNGYAPGISGSGGGIYCSSSSSPTIMDCIITNSTAYFGGGIYGSESLFIIDCIIYDNTAFQSGGGIHCYGPLSITGSIVENNTTPFQGGGISCGDASTITSCIIRENEASGTSAVAGGIHCSGNVNIINSTISGNRIYLDYENLLGNGGGIYCGGSSTVTGCMIFNNEATGVSGGSGGGIYCRDSAVITNALILGNDSTGPYAKGGGISCGNSNVITNCTVAGNEATGTSANAGGIYCSGSPTITNCILWVDTPNEIYGGSPVINHCDVQGGYSGTGNINSYPEFVYFSGSNPANWDLHLQCSSPCIDTGDNYAPQIPQEDFEGDSRIFDNDGDGIAEVDIGADESAFHRHQLTDGGVTPDSGDPHTIFRFTVYYYHPDLRAPTVKNVVINGVSHDMQLLSGDPAYGTYYYDTTLKPGSNYYFNFNDGYGCTIRLPSTGYYMGPLVSNQCPELSNSGMDPNSGDNTTMFHFTVNYFDPDGMTPTTTRVIIDGGLHTMELLSGTHSNGTYYYDTTLNPGAKYYYSFNDGYGCSTRLPSEGSFDGPTVTGFIHYVPDDYLTIQAALDDSASGDTIIVRSGRYTGEGNKNLNFNGKAVILRSENGFADSIIDCEKDGRAFYFNSGEESTSVVDGFTITNSNILGAGGAVYCTFSAPTFCNCRFVGNTASSSGGGIFCTRSRGLTIVNCIFTENSAGSRGGGVCLIDFEDYFSSIYVINCTFVSNSATTGGGICSQCFSINSSVITNNILWGNTATSGPQLAASGQFLVSYCDVQGGQSQVSGSVDWGDGNIDADPRFIDPNIIIEPNDPNADWFGGDYHLKSQAGRWDANSKSWVQDHVTSLCIDAGDPNSDWTAELWPHGKQINMGAYGGTPQASMSLSDAGNIADLDNDGFVGYADMFTDKWLCEEFLLPEDLNRDGFVNFVDIAIFAGNFEPPPPP